jgi:DNA (cytosine-5)-methyltransferase 1
MKVRSPEMAAGDPYSERLTAIEFFAGIGLMRLGLDRAGIKTVWANDIDPAKREMYAANFGSDGFVLADIRDVQADTVPPADIATASFPCIDLSVAGNRQGLGQRSAPKTAYWQSSMFWEFIRLLREMGSQAPGVVMCENVLGFANSNGGRDLETALRALNALGYSCDVLLVDARHFVPQSRPRVFIVGAKPPWPPTRPLPLTAVRPLWALDLVDRYPDLILHNHPLPELPAGPPSLSGYIEQLPVDDERWWGEERLRRFLESLSPIQSARLDQLRARAGKSWRTAYRRTRKGRPVWEIRRDGIAGCLRTARGGSSKQALVEVDRGEVRVRWMTGREYANLMGAPSTYRLPDRRVQALHGFGDAVCVPVISWLCKSYIVPLAERSYAGLREAA